MKKLSSHNRELFALTFGEFWDRFSFFGTLTVLVLYLSTNFALSDRHSYDVYGIYLALSFGLPVIGGILADRLLGFRFSIIIGALFLIAGNILLFIPKLDFVYLGLALTICGIGLYKVSCTSLVGNLYAPESMQRERAYVLFYAGMNIGAILGPIMYGAISIMFGLRYGFLCNAIGIAIGLFVFLTTYKPAKNAIKNGLAKTCAIKSVAIISILLGCLIVFYLLQHITVFDSVAYIVAFLLVIAFIVMLPKYSKLERNRIIAILILTLFSVFFFIASLQVGSTIIMFINRDVHHVIFGWAIPSVVFNSLDPLFVVLAAPLFAITWIYLAKRKHEPSVTIKLFLGLIMACLGLFSFILAASATSLPAHWIALTYVIFGYVFLGAGEICLAPAILTMISNLAPKRIYATLMGVNSLALAFAGYLSGVMAKLSAQTFAGLTTAQGKATSANIYAHTFWIILIVIAVAAIALLLLSPVIKSLTHGDSY
ncbi:MAG: MFS transporter [Gammaproteobacteria bacterium]|nr:MFS transporter [Gammaproteobacteria bacterium]